MGKVRSMSITVRYFAAVKDVTGKDREAIEVEEGASLGAIFKSLISIYPELETLSSVVLYSLNHEHADPGCKVKDGDEVGIFPPISGG